MSEETQALQALMKKVEEVLDGYHMDVDYEMEEAKGEIFEAFMIYIAFMREITSRKI